MKKILLSLAAIAVTFTACNNTPKYTINGTVEGEQTGNVFVLKRNGSAYDTLAKTVITDGKFLIEGTVDGITDASLAVEGKRGGTLIFLENAIYTATLNPANPADNKIEGTELQALANQFGTISKELRKVQNDLYKEYSTASQEKNEEKMKEIEATFEEKAKASEAQEEELMKANPDSYVSAYILVSKMGQLELDKLTEKFNALGENAKASAPGVKIAERIAKLDAVAIGKVAPDFTLNNPEGTPVSMHSIKGKVKIIDFWASWCGPCRGENPNVVKIYEEFHPKGLEIIGVSLDRDKDAWLKAIEDDKLSWNHVSDLKFWDCEAAKQYAVNSIPHVLILDENNTIVARNLRGDELKAKIAEMLQ